MFSKFNSMFQRPNQSLFLNVCANQSLFFYVCAYLHLMRNQTLWFLQYSNMGFVHDPPLNLVFENSLNTSRMWTFFFSIFTWIIKTYIPNCLPENKAIWEWLPKPYPFTRNHNVITLRPYPDGKNFSVNIPLLNGFNQFFFNFSCPYQRIYQKQYTHTTLVDT